MKLFLPLAGVLFTFILVGYLESPYSMINKDHVRLTSIPNEVLLAEAQAASEPVSIEEETGETEEVQAQNYTLEMILEEKNVDGDYVVETYREYEIYRDENGEIIKKVPTSNYDYLRYYK